MTLKTFTAVYTHLMSTCSKFRSGPSTEYGDITSHNIGVNGRSNHMILSSYYCTKHENSFDACFQCCGGGAVGRASDLRLIGRGFEYCLDTIAQWPSTYTCVPALRTFPGKLLSRKDDSRKDVSRKDVSRIVIFPERRFRIRRFPDNHFPGKSFPGKTFPGKKTLCLNFSW